jgi:hypothetical protein
MTGMVFCVQAQTTQQNATAQMVLKEISGLQHNINQMLCNRESLLGTDCYS